VAFETFLSHNTAPCSSALMLNVFVWVIVIEGMFSEASYSIAKNPV
jgi:ABC-type multidrug transport system permease subunit